MLKYQVKEASVKRLLTMWFQVYVLKKTGKIISCHGFIRGEEDWIGET